jgi:hypothetical protein
MIKIGPSRNDLPTDWLSCAGAFLWWYIDLVDTDGSGAVCIWSYGLPFSPGLAAQARKGQALPPQEKPGWNLVVYRDHKPIFYTLQEFRPEDCSWDREGQVWTMGKTSFRRTTVDGHVHVDIDFDCELTGVPDRLIGSLNLAGPLRKEDEAHPKDDRFDLSRAAGHTWEPIALGGANAKLALTMGEWSTALSGRAYHDRNGGKIPLQQQGIRHWNWGRFAFPDRELVLYLVELENGSSEWTWLEVDQTGACAFRPVESVTHTRRKRSIYGPTWSQSIQVATADGVTVHVHQGHPIDNGPFYLRHFATAEIDGYIAHGISELVDPSRVDMAIHRPLVKMRIDNQSPSMWLPLFHGPKIGRIGRLFQSWVTS